MGGAAMHISSLYTTEGGVELQHVCTLKKGWGWGYNFTLHTKEGVGLQQTHLSPFQQHQSGANYLSWNVCTLFAGVSSMCYNDDLGEGWG